MKNMKGITLVSLVVTIIVLIILAGVSINLTVGENGIITMAKKARENMELAKVDEERQLNELYMQIEQEGLSGEISYDAIAKLIEFKREIASAITDMGIATEENADATTMSSNIRSLTGAASADKVSYDNTNSGLTATNVQGAVDELNESLEKDENGMSLHEKMDKLLNGTNIVKDFYNLSFMGEYKAQNVKNTMTLSRDFAKGTFLFVSGNNSGRGSKVILNETDITSTLIPLQYGYMGGTTSSQFGCLLLPPDDLELHIGDVITIYHTGGGAHYEGIAYQ